MKNKKEILKSYSFNFKILILTINIVLLAVFFLLAKNCALAQIDAYQLILMTNQERLKNGLEALEVNQTLINVASSKCQDMIDKNYFAHTSPDGKHFWQWLKEVDYDYLYAGENLAIDFTDNDEVIKAWIASSTHRANILNPKYQQIGLVAQEGLIDGKKTIIIVQEFGTLYQPIEQKNSSPNAENLLTANSSEPTPFSLPSLTAYDKVDLFANLPAENQNFPQFLTQSEMQNISPEFQVVFSLNKEDPLIFNKNYQNDFLTKTLNEETARIKTAGFTKNYLINTEKINSLALTLPYQIASGEIKKDVLGASSTATSNRTSVAFIRSEKKFNQLIYLFILLFASIFVNLISLTSKLQARKQSILAQ